MPSFNRRRRAAARTAAEAPTSSAPGAPAPERWAEASLRVARARAGEQPASDQAALSSPPQEDSPTGLLPVDERARDDRASAEGSPASDLDQLLAAGESATADHPAAPSPLLPGSPFAAAPSAVPSAVPAAAPAPATAPTPAANAPTPGDRSPDAVPFGTRATPMTLRAIRGMRDLSLGDRWALVAAIRGMALESTPQRVALSLAALGACFEDEGRISKGVYAEWRDRQPRPDEWPSTKALAAPFNKSWKRAMAAFGADAVLDVLVSDITPDSAEFTEAEVTANLVEYGESKLPLQFDRYHAWAQDRMGDPGRRLERYVLSPKTIIDLFGSWEQALFAAGLGDRLNEEQGSRPSRRGGAEPYTQDRMAETLAEAFGPGNPLGPVPKRSWTKKVFDRWAAQAEAEARARGQYLKVARADTVCAAFEGWGNGLFAAGLISKEERDQRAGHRTEFRPDEELIEALQRALGPTATTLRVTDFRKCRDRTGVVDGRKLPSDALIRDRFGGWDVAVERAVADRDKGRASVPSTTPVKAAAKAQRPKLQPKPKRQPKPRRTARAAGEAAASTRGLLRSEAA